MSCEEYSTFNNLMALPSHYTICDFFPMF